MAVKKRRITKTGEDITDLDEEERKKKIEEAGVATQTPTKAPPKQDIIKRDSVAVTPSGNTVVNAPKDDVKLQRVAEQQTQNLQQPQQITEDLQRQVLSSEGLPTTPEGQKALFEQQKVGEVPQYNEILPTLSPVEEWKRYRETGLKEGVFADLIENLEDTSSLQDKSGVSFVLSRASREIAERALKAAQGGISAGESILLGIGQAVPFDIFGSGAIQNIQSSLETKNQIVADTARDVQDGTITAMDGFKIVEATENRVNQAEEEIRIRLIKNPAARFSQEALDIQEDIYELRLEIARARRDISLAVVGEQDPEKLTIRLKELKGKQNI